MFAPESIRALLFSLAAGLSTLLGALVIVFTKKKSEKLVTVSLGFAGGVMISVSFWDMLPEAVHALGDEKLGTLLSVAFLIVGVLMAAGLDRLVPHKEEPAEDGGAGTRSHLFRMGLVSMLAIGLHNFPEGIATFMAGFENAALGVSIAVAIALHNIPEGISVAMPIYFATGDRKKALKYAFLSGISEPLGALLAFLVLQPIINHFIMGTVFAILAGIMLYIAIEELIPSSRQYGHTREALIATFAGICLMPLSNIIG